MNAAGTPVAAWLAGLFAAGLAVAGAALWLTRGEAILLDLFGVFCL